MIDNNHSHKRDVILNMINFFGPVSRKKLTLLTDYRPATIGELTKELIDEQIVTETGSFSVGHGRKRILLDINADHLCAIGVSFSSKDVTYIVSQFKGIILQRIDFPVPEEMDKKVLASEILLQIQQLLRQYADKKFVGIGICEPLYNPINYTRKTVADSIAHFNDWLYDSLKPDLEKSTGLTVKTFSAVTLPAIAEKRFGVAQDTENFIWMELSNGIGSSIYCNGQPVSGANNYAGEIGHTVVDGFSAAPTICYCGKHNCVEQIAAFPALSRRIRNAVESGVSSYLTQIWDASRKLTVQDIKAAIDHHDQLCMYYVKQAASHLGIAIANAINLTNPQVLILSGFMMELGDYFLSQLKNTIRENVLVISSDFEIRISLSPESILPLGAVAEMFSDYLNMKQTQWVYQLSKADFDDSNSLDQETE